MGMSAPVQRYTIEDLEHFPNDGNRYEIINGVLHVSPGPGLWHQRVSMRLAVTFANALMIPGHAEVAASGTVMLPPGTQLEPDILVYPLRVGNDTWSDVTEYWLAVEILSKSTRRYDRNEKVDAYFDLGVREVWLIDRRDKSIEQFASRDRSEKAFGEFVWRAPNVDIDVGVDVPALFAGIGKRFP